MTLDMGEGKSVSRRISGEGELADRRGTSLYARRWVWKCGTAWGKRIREACCLPTDQIHADQERGFLLATKRTKGMF
jgi:hypothetical protein